MTIRTNIQQNTYHKIEHWMAKKFSNKHKIELPINDRIIIRSNGEQKIE
jgi:hypothetical protein